VFVVDVLIFRQGFRVEKYKKYAILRVIQFDELNRPSLLAKLI